MSGTVRYGLIFSHPGSIDIAAALIGQELYSAIILSAAI